MINTFTKNLTDDLRILRHPTFRVRRRITDLEESKMTDLAASALTMRETSLA